MLIFRPLPMTTCSESWVLDSSVLLRKYGSPAYVPPDWNSNIIYSQGQSTNDKGYDFISITNNNNSRPSDNFQGRMARSNDAITQSGLGTWVRKGYTNKYKCFVPGAAGFTESFQSPLDATIDMAAGTIEPELILLPIERLFLLCSGITGASLSVNALNYGGSSITGSNKALMLSPIDTDSLDFTLNPELLSTAQSFLYPALAGLAAETNSSITESFRVEITPVDSAIIPQRTCFAENILVGRLTRIGNLQWSNHKFDTMDRSKIDTDAWGIMSMSKRRVSKAVNCEVILEAIDTDIVSTLSNVYHLLAYLRGQVNSFILTNQKIELTSDYSLNEIDYADVITGILKTFSISDIYKDKALLSMTIESIPTGYKV